MVISYDNFEKWMNSVFDSTNLRDVTALNFNIYEDADNSWSIEAVGTSSFDEGDEDWACDEIADFGTRDNPYVWKEETTWNRVLSEITSCIQKYLEKGKNSEKLKETSGIGCGFVDGDIEILYVKKRDK